MNDEKSFSYPKLIAGLLCGAILGTVCSALLYAALFVLGNTHLAYLAPFINAAALILLGLVVYKNSKDKGFSRGMLISLGLVLILSTKCGFVLWRA